MDSGAKFQALTMPNSDAQFLESRVFQTAEIGRFFGVPPFLLGITEKSTSWGTGLEQQAIGWVTYDLHPAWLAPTEQRITKELTPSGRYARYTVDGLLRGDSTARAALWRTMREIGAMNADEVRDRENLPAIPDGSGQGYLQPMNMQALGLNKGIGDGGDTNQEGGGDGGSD
jgi:HK97 family phage portal protein